MAAVARLPQGALVLPGLDPACRRRSGPGSATDDPGAAEHPQQGFRRLADALGFDPAAVPAWHPVAPPAPARNALVSLALRPAPVTDQWLSDGAALAGTLAAAAAGLDWVEAPDPRAEAQAIALVLREAAETGTRAALVTPDRTLARRVTAELGRWGLIPDDSAGRPLALTPPGVLLRRLAALPGTTLTPQDLLVLLKHPLVASAPGARGGHLRLTARLERRHLRGGAPWIDWDAVARWAAAQEDPAATPWAAWLRAALAPLAAAGGRAPLALHVARTRAAAETLAAGPAGASRPRALGEGGGAAGAGADAGARRRGRRRRPAPAGGVPRAAPDAHGRARRAGGGGGDARPHRHLGHARGAGAVGGPDDPRRAQRGDLAAPARHRSLAQPRASAASSGCRARSSPSGFRRTTSSRRWGPGGWC